MAAKSNKAGRRHGPLKLWHVPIGLLVVVAIFGLLVRWRWRREFRQRVEKIRAAGLPVTLSELDAWYEWPGSGGNAAHWVDAAAAIQRSLSWDDWKRLQEIVNPDMVRPDPTKAVSGDLKELMERCVGDNARAIELWHDAAAIRSCRYPIDLTQGTGTLLPHIGPLRDGCLLLCMEGVLRAERSDSDGAARAIQSVSGLAHSLDLEPVLISHAVRMRLAGWAACALERALNQVAFTAEQLETLDRAFGDIPAAMGLRRGLAGDLCMMLPVFEAPAAIDRRRFDERIPRPALLEVYHVLGLSAREAVLFVDYMNELIRIAELPQFERCAAVRAAEVPLLDKPVVVLLHEEVRRASAIVSGQVRILAEVELTRAALAVEQCRRADGTLPEGLAELVPDWLDDVPADPFDGRPLRYERTGRGFAVRSVGDDSRVLEPRESQGLIFRVER